MQYRGAFWAGVVGQWLSYGATFITLFILASGFNAVSGWDANHILFLYALNVLSYAIAASFFYMFSTQLSEKVRGGSFDDTLTKPVSPFVYEFLQSFISGYFSHATLAIAMMIYSLIKIQFQVTFISVLTLLGAIIGASLIQAALLVVISTASFVMINDNPLLDLLWDLKSFTDYPIGVYPAFIQMFLTCILPVAFICYYPASSLLNIDTGMVFPKTLGYFTPIVGILLFVVSVKIWHVGLSRYQSTGT
jgi:ABC-2 type transport system permease protein